MPADPLSNGPRLPVGLLVAGSEMVSFALVGLLLDWAFGTMPILTITFTLLGALAAFYLVVKMAGSLGRRRRTPPDAGGEA
jgi:F0F1-type ATP synthase assembly protein I